MNKNEILDYIHPIENAPCECSDKIELTPIQSAMVDIMYWARNSTSGKDEAISLTFFPCPKGIIDKKGWWWPSPLEACDANINHYTQTTKKINPWAWYHHCKTKQHISYLLIHRKTYFLKMWCHQGPLLYNLVKTLMTEPEKISLLINTENPILKKFVNDILSNCFISLIDYVDQALVKEVV